MGEHSHDLDPADLKIRTWVDDDLVQDGSTAEMVTGIGDMIAVLSRLCTLEPTAMATTSTTQYTGTLTPHGAAIFGSQNQFAVVHRCLDERERFVEPACRL